MNNNLNSVNGLGSSTFEDFGNIFKNIAIAGVALGVVYLVIKNNSKPKGKK